MKMRATRFSPTTRFTLTNPRFEPYGMKIRDPKRLDSHLDMRALTRGDPHEDEGDKVQPHRHVAQALALPGHNGIGPSATK
jgi:hypothetical protein